MKGCRFCRQESGIESLPIFPNQVVASVRDTAQLRIHYEALLEKVLDRQSLSLVDVFRGGNTPVEEYWAKPDTAGGAKARRRPGTPW